MRLFSTSISTRLLLAFAAPTALVFAITGGFTYLSTRDAFRDEFARKLDVLATTIAAQVDTDRVLSLLPGDEDERWYLDLAAELERQKRAAGLSALYLIDPRGQVFVDADRSYRIEEKLPHWDADRPLIARALQRLPGAWIEDTDRPQPIYRAYKRLDVSRPDAAALGDEPSAADVEPLLLGVEAGLQYRASIRRYATTATPVGLISIALIVLIALVVSHTITRPVSLLVEDARHIGEGALDVPVRAHGRDEIGFLAKTIDEMRAALQRRDRDRQAMLAGIAHEVRNPLGGMELFIGLLREGIDELTAAQLAEQRTQLREYSGRVERELSYLKGVVNDFLAFARETPVNLQPCRVRQMFDDIVGVVAGDAEQRELTVAIECPPELAIEADEGALRRALLNLVQNALQATAAGGRVTMRADDRGSQVALAITDTGKGIPADKLADVETPFFTTKEKGTGLGLSIAGKIARVHGGQLTIDSIEGRGTTVTLIVPRRATAGAAGV
ncbi:MAG: HAMP domain-containing histidine kinase [Deltaproteobacteria bacterium]|nr:HAMP domain-containing histidine kinase [Deltaproteobacteria bacterium]